MSRMLIRPANDTTIERPQCSACGSSMWLRHIARQSDGQEEQRTFECPVCEVSVGDGHVDGGQPSQERPARTRRD